MRSTSKNVAALTAAVALIGAAFVAGPAQAAKKGVKCSPYSSAVEGAAEVPVTKITPAATEAKPVTITLEHPMSGPVAPDLQFANIQVFGPSGSINIREEFAGHSDIDLYLFDAAGEEVASSGAFNPAPIPGVTDADGNGGMGFESIPGFAVSQCAGFTIESSAYLTPGTEATITIWFGK